MDQSINKIDAASLSAISQNLTPSSEGTLKVSNINLFRIVFNVGLIALPYQGGE